MRNATVFAIVAAVMLVWGCQSPAKVSHQPNSPRTAAQPHGQKAPQIQWHELSRPKDMPRPGTETYLGVAAGPVDEALRTHLALPDGEGLMVIGVAPGSPAAQAGIQRFDVLTHFNHQTLINNEQLNVLVHNAKADQEISLTGFRKGKQATLMVKLASHETPRFLNMPGAPPMPGMPGGPMPGQMGPGMGGQGPMQPGMGNQGPMRPGMNNQRPMGPGMRGQGQMRPGMENQRPMGPGMRGQGPMQPGMENQRPMGPEMRGQGPMRPGMNNQRPMGPGMRGQGPMQPGMENQRPMGPGMRGQGPMQPGMENRRPMGPGMGNPSPMQPRQPGREVNRPRVIEIPEGKEGEGVRIEIREGANGQPDVKVIPEGRQGRERPEGRQGREGRERPEGREGREGAEGREGRDAEMRRLVEEAWRELEKLEGREEGMRRPEGPTNRPGNPAPEGFRGEMVLQYQEDGRTVQGFHDNEYALKITTDRNGSKTLVARSVKDQKVVFEGSVNTPDDRAKMPAPVRRRFEQIHRNPEFKLPAPAPTAKPGNE